MAAEADRAMDFVSPPPRQIWIEKNPGRGEDGPVLIRFNSRLSILVMGVFDGLGGSGGRMVRAPSGGDMSAARYAADLAAQVTNQLLDDLGFDPAPDAADSDLFDPRALPRWSTVATFQQTLQERLRQNFNEQAARVEKESSGIRGSLTKRLPTTICLLVAQRGEAPKSTHVSAIWAGDSRAFVWTRGAGLAQLTRDHTRAEIDAFRAIREDAPMSNFVTPDLPFHLSGSAGVTIQEPCIFFCSTDGGFQYFPSPMEHENALAHCLAQKKPWEEAVDDFGRVIQSVTQDDVAMAIAGAHWRPNEPAEAFRAALNSRLKQLMGPINDLQQKFSDADRDLKNAQQKRADLQARLDKLRQDNWERYKANYEKLAPAFSQLGAPSVENAGEDQESRA